MKDGDFDDAILGWEKMFDQSIAPSILTLGNQPKTGGLCLWSWMMSKCIM